MNSTGAKIIYFFNKQGGICAYCQQPLIWNVDGLAVNCDIDHIIPKSRGGKEHLENLCLACQACNQTKANMTAEEYKSALTLVAEGKVKKADLPQFAQYLALREKFAEVASVLPRHLEVKHE